MAVTRWLDDGVGALARRHGLPLLVLVLAALGTDAVLRHSTVWHSAEGLGDDPATPVAVAPMPTPELPADDRGSSPMASLPPPAPEETSQEPPSPPDEITVMAPVVTLWSQPSHGGFSRPLGYLVVGTPVQLRGERVTGPKGWRWLAVSARDPDGVALEGYLRSDLLMGGGLTPQWGTRHGELVASSTADVPLYSPQAIDGVSHLLDPGTPWLLQRLPGSTVVTVHRSQRGAQGFEWHKITAADGHQGWVRADAIRPSSPPRQGANDQTTAWETPRSPGAPARALRPPPPPGPGSPERPTVYRQAAMARARARAHTAEMRRLMEEQFKRSHGAIDRILSGDDR